ncbi:AAA family ATPase [Parasediminibacterium paludis]|uniref:AAA family ATPase n=1 Tax=Parasediminibacterium paludis TaxID=908966 RepID=A0ABV8PYS7_9BACT
MAIIIIAIFMIRVVMLLMPLLRTSIINGWHKIINTLKKQKPTGLFDEYFIEAKNFYLKEFNTMPCIAYIGNVNTSAIFSVIQSGQFGKVTATYQRNYFNWQQEQIEFSKTLFKLQGKMMVKLGDDWLEILFSNNDYDRANKMLHTFKTMKAPQKEDDYEINIISLSGGSLDLKTLAIKPTKLDINLYYNDDFLAVHNTINERLSKENDKGIVLLHGLPGTGKTTYLRYLIGNLKKKVMFVSPSVAGNLMNPEFMDLLLDNPNSILVIEDAENIIMDRRYSSQSSVSNLLNISDGLLSDCLNVQIICTFNSELHLVDNALLRKGRLIARYEFSKLATVKAQALAKHLQKPIQVNKPMTLAEITNPEETHHETKQVNVIGFRRLEPVLEN